MHFSRPKKRFYNGRQSNQQVTEKSGTSETTREAPAEKRDDDIVQQDWMEKQTQDIVVGSLLGDGWLDALSPRTGTSIYRLKYDDRSLAFLKRMRQALSELEPSDLKTKPKYTQHFFYTRAREDIGKLRRIFYPHEGRKRVPENIGSLLTNPLSLAIWYQDDGTLDRRSKYHWNSRIATYCFPEEDCVRLKNALRDNFGIEVSVCRNSMRGKVYYELYVLSKSMEQFVDIVRPHMHQTFAYKILRLPMQETIGQQER